VKEAKSQIKKKESKNRKQKEKLAWNRYFMEQHNVNSIN